jgi:hypothetical protein
MHESRRRAATLAIAAAGVLVVHGCTERLEGGGACPILCPGQSVELRDTLHAAVVLDTTLEAYPGPGDERQHLLISRGDTLETRLIIRYDTLPTAYTPPNSPTETPIEMVAEAHVALRLQFPTRDPTQTVTVEAYDVDTTSADGADTTAADILPLFRSDRFLGSLSFKPVDVRQTVDSTISVPVDSAYLAAKIQAKARLRVGLLVRGDHSPELMIQGLAAVRRLDITFVASAGELTAPDTASPNTAVPAERFVAASLGDFVIVASRRAPDALPQVIAVGGTPGKRTYIRFDLPSGIIDSTSVVRATLLLTQYPNRLAAHGPDSVTLFPASVAAADVVTDVGKAASLLSPPPPAFQIDSLRLTPGGSGAVEIEVGGAVQLWRAFGPGPVSRAIVLRVGSLSEGAMPDELYFYSRHADADLRPRLRIVYVPRVGFGLP